MVYSNSFLGTELNKVIKCKTALHIWLYKLKINFIKVTKAIQSRAGSDFFVVAAWLILRKCCHFKRMHWSSALILYVQPAMSAIGYLRAFWHNFCVNLSIQTQYFRESLIFARVLRSRFAHFWWAHAQIFSLCAQAHVLWLLKGSSGAKFTLQVVWT